MKNKLTDLNNHLFEQLETLKDAKNTDIAIEIERTKGVVEISKQIIDGANVSLTAAKLVVANESKSKADILPEQFLASPVVPAIGTSQ